MMSTGGSVAPSNFVMSPTWVISGNRICVTSMGKVSISLAQTGTTLLRMAASGKPPIPSKRLPIVSMAYIRMEQRGCLSANGRSFSVISCSVTYRTGMLHCLTEGKVWVYPLLEFGKEMVSA